MSWESGGRWLRPSKADREALAKARAWAAFAASSTTSPEKARAFREHEARVRAGDRVAANGHRYPVDPAHPAQFASDVCTCCGEVSK